MAFHGYRAMQDGRDCSWGQIRVFKLPKADRFYSLAINLYDHEAPRNNSSSCEQLSCFQNVGRTTFFEFRICLCRLWVFIQETIPLTCKKLLYILDSNDLYINQYPIFELIDTKCILNYELCPHVDYISFPDKYSHF